ncbi:MAG: cysteine desulfurase family protein [Anaerostipes sp.]|jgi:cysteine desulfurase|nr:aminotransferase class V-fold PLP-dependent enzyme [uncultured Anaerostipes sp.]
MSKENCEREARQKIAASIGALPEEIYFTSGRADGHRKVLKAVIRASKKARPHVIITTMEDPEVLDECTILERKDAVVTYLDPITTGRVEVAMIENELKENTELVSVTAANCQTGTSEPFTGIGTLTSQKGMIFHTDAAFAFGKMPINVEKSHIDMLTADASYFGGPENAGFLYVRKTTGAGEYVSETALSEEVLDEMSTMAEDLAANAATFMEEIRPVRNHLCERIFTEIEDVELNGHKDHHLANHLNIRVKNVSAAVVQKVMKEHGIEVGIGTNSNILTAIGRSKAESAESVSFSLKSGTTMEDADKIVDILKEIVTGERTVL